MTEQQLPHPAVVRSQEDIDLLAACVRLAATASAPTYFKTAVSAKVRSEQ